MIGQPWALTLWTWCQMMERRRIEGWTARMRDLDRAQMTAEGMVDTKHLATRRANLLAEARRVETGADEVAAAREKATAVQAFLKRRRRRTRVNGG